MLVAAATGPASPGGSAAGSSDAIRPSGAVALLQHGLLAQQLAGAAATTAIVCDRIWASARGTIIDVVLLRPLEVDTWRTRLPEAPRS